MRALAELKAEMLDAVTPLPTCIKVLLVMVVKFSFHQRKFTLTRTSVVQRRHFVLVRILAKDPNETKRQLYETA